MRIQPNRLDASRFWAALKHTLPHEVVFIQDDNSGVNRGQLAAIVMSVET